MSLFRNKKREKMEHMSKMIGGLNITSKAALKQFCLMATQCDVAEAKELYDFLIKDLDELPMLDPVKPTTMQNVKMTANEIFNFFRDNKEGIAESVSFVRAMFGKGSGIVADTAAAAAPVTEPIPPIN